MTQRDLLWRAAGAALVGIGYALTRVATNAAADLIGIVGLLVAAAGLLLLLAGKKAALALRVERSRHRELPGAIRASRRARRDQR
ncbi:xanthosine utilization system XapX-like protein [Sphingopyxis sp. OAS728]|uniref:hypothetical protein n=1 Tax=Sphingopyxis sp. OAS728 TaxID=2663823 RepID=UPI00178B2FBE|nr:hypothetical protein [Sphingopyxis sp. OAS728]MBE1527247.1 xanthosine utilization system XapX-like protein [Sphingopyxis sp. OAS728]